MITGCCAHGWLSVDQRFNNINIQSEVNASEFLSMASAEKVDLRWTKYKYKLAYEKETRYANRFYVFLRQKSAHHPHVKEIW
jgi:hypothetical protein